MQEHTQGFSPESPKVLAKCLPPQKHVWIQYSTSIDGQPTQCCLCGSQKARSSSAFTSSLILIFIAHHHIPNSLIPLHREQLREAICCEILLYWSSGPEVPWLNATCAVDGDSVSPTVRHRYYRWIHLFCRFKESSPDDSRVAFDLGTTYSYSYQTSTAQTFTHIRPQRDTGSCGYC